MSEVNHHIVELIGDAPYPMWLLKGEMGDIIWANQQAEAWVQRSVRVQQSRNLPDVLALPQDVRDGYNRCFEFRQSVIIRNCTMILSDQESPKCDLTIFPTGEYIGLMLQMSSPEPTGVSTNIDAMSAMGRMLAHEIKNPLAGMSGAVQLLKPDVEGEEAQSLLSLIGSEIERIRRLADRMETLGDKDPENLTAVNVHEVLHRAAKVMSSEAGRIIKFSEAYDPSLPTITADEDTLMQAILNLIKNAVEAMEHSGEGQEITLKTLYRAGVRRRTRESEKSASLPIEIQIKDDGPGIPDHIRGQMFQPFVSAKPTGQGLGLAIVSKIIHAHGGIIEVSSRPGRTKFSILLPLKHETIS